MTGSDATAHDVVQETFAKLWTVRPSLDDVDALEPYVFQIARRRVYNLHRNERVRRNNEAMLDEEDLGSTPPSPDQEVNTELLRRLLHRWIDELPERQREALCLRRLDGLSHDAIADVMGISTNTVNTHLVRAMEHLRSRLRTLND